MRLHTVFVSYNRLEYLKQAVASWLETVSVPATYVIVDNGSTDGSEEWLRAEHAEHTLLLGENRYPGYACNRGWENAPAEADFLQRCDNDFTFLPGWCERVQDVLEASVGQVGLRTDWEEQYARWNVGGNCIIRRSLFDAGLRYDERPWPEYPPGYTEDSFFSPAVEQMGFRWVRVLESCIVSLAHEGPDDPYWEYYKEGWRNRNILDWALDRHGIRPSQ